MPEPYRVLVVANFPVNFSDGAAKRLVSIATNGPRCGVFTLVTVDSEQPLPYGFNLSDLERAATVVTVDPNRFTIQDGDFRDFALAPDLPPDTDVFNEIVEKVGDSAKRATTVKVPFARIAPPSTAWWSQSTSEGIAVPIGVTGATKRRQLALGKGTSQHALIAGKTGSGKSTLLHVLITNLALTYSPEEVELYLIDFKKGVEFKTYAQHQLPHARVIAIESEREFGLSVLQGLDDEMTRRGKLFRSVADAYGDVQNVAAYRQKTKQPLPRIMLIVDEFQEFFSDDAPLAQQAGQILDRLVRQGRSFGIHVLLGSQPLSGAYSLNRSTMDQMAVRIALQCSEADSRLILSDDNPAARLLSRPGEAIYNDANGLVEGNDPFQTVWLEDEEREVYLDGLHALAQSHRPTPGHRQIVFEGNAPADAAKNDPLADLVRVPSWPAAPRAIPAWLGEPIAIKEPTAAVFRRQAGSNLLVVGQHEEAALGMMMTAILSLAAQHAPTLEAGRFSILDLTPTDAPHVNRLKDLLSRLPHFPGTAQLAGRRDVPRVIAEVAEEVDRRLAADETSAAPIYLFVYGLMRARDLRQDESLGYSSFDSSYGDEPATPNPAKQFTAILREGPDLDIHTVVWCDTLANLNRTLDRRALSEFDMRVALQMGEDDSSNLVDSPAASRLGPHRALFFSEEQGRLEKFRPYGLPDEAWLGWVGEHLRARAAPSVT